MGNKYISIQKMDLRKKSVECIRSNIIKTCVDSTYLLGFVDCLKTIVDEGGCEY